MSDRNFEKQIQQKLDELKIPPAGTVWSGVEARIRKDKRRRRGIIFFPLLFLLIGSGCYFIFHDTFSFTNNSVTKSSSPKANPNNNNSTLENQKTVKDITINNQQKDNSNNGNKQTAPKDVQIEQSPGKRNSENMLSSKKVGNNDVSIEKIRVSDQETGLEKPFNKTTVSTRNKKPQAKNRTQQESIADQVVTDRNISENNQNKKIDRNQNGEKIQSFGKEVEELVSSADLKANKITYDEASNRVSDSIDNNNLTQKKPADTLSPNSIVEAKKTVNKKIKYSNWKWGLNASFGISNMIDGNFFDGVIGGEKALVADVSLNASTNATSSGGAGAIIYDPSTIEKGFSFSAGAFIQKNISKRWSVSTGLHYSYYSTHIRVGNRIDSSAMVQNAFGLINVDQFFRSAPVTTTQEYTNRFHFVGLPISIHTQLNKSNRLPLFWDAGISLSYLVSTNALHFDSRTGVYYKDNELFNKLQANLSTGFSVSIWNTSNMPVHIGPQIQYGATNFMKSKVSGSKHLFYFGLNTSIFLKK